MALRDDIWSYPEKPKQTFSFLVLSWHDASDAGNPRQYEFSELREAVKFVKEKNFPLHRVLIKRKLLITTEEIIPHISWPEY